MNFYREMDAFFAEHPKADGLVRQIGTVLSAGLGAAYAGLCILHLGRDGRVPVRVIVYPAACFAGGSLLRRAVNAPRPADDMPDLKRKSIKHGGKSFPSRHCFSAAVIAAALAVEDPRAGMAAAAAAAALAVQRVLAGDHYVRDAAAGLACGAIFGWIGFFKNRK